MPRSRTLPSRSSAQSFGLSFESTGKKRFCLKSQTISKTPSPPLSLGYKCLGAYGGNELEGGKVARGGVIRFQKTRTKRCMQSEQNGTPPMSPSAQSLDHVVKIIFSNRSDQISVSFCPKCKENWKRGRVKCDKCSYSTRSLSLFEPHPVLVYLAPLTAVVLSLLVAHNLKVLGRVRDSYILSVLGVGGFLVALFFNEMIDTGLQFLDTFFFAIYSLVLVFLLVLLHGPTVNFWRVCGARTKTSLWYYITAFGIAVMVIGFRLVHTIVESDIEFQSGFFETFGF